MAPCSLAVFDQPAFWHLDAARGPSTPSFDHLVGGGEQRLWDTKAERLRSLEVDDKLELRRVLHWQIGRLGTLEDAIHVGGRAAVQVDEVDTIGHQPASSGEEGERIDRT